MKHARQVVLGVSGSIAAYKAGDIIRGLRQKGLTVSVVMTREAEAFITPLTLQTLSANKVHSALFGEAPEWDIEHIGLADRADLVLIAPATANIIGKLAAGICDDLLTCVVTATKTPVLIAPAMNDGMYTNKIVQDNITRLKKMGYVFIGPRKGRLACGREGIGRMCEAGEIVEVAIGLLKKG